MVKSHGKKSHDVIILVKICGPSDRDPPKSQVKKGLLCQLFGGTAKPVSSKAETKGPRADKPMDFNVKILGKPSMVM